VGEFCVDITVKYYSTKPLMFLKLYGIGFGLFILMDGIWLGLVAKSFYSKYLGYLMSQNPNWTAAIVFYLLYMAGLVYLVVQPAVAGGNWQDALIKGAVFGLVCYATYDLTNLATINKWPIIVTVVDLIWGTVLSGTISYLTFIVSKRLGI